MRRSRDETAESRTRILAAAAGLFRERGPENVSVAQVMRAAGMTHGGFYKHFASKEALLVATINAIFAEKRGRLGGKDAGAAAAALEAYAESYLSPAHAIYRQTGCPIATLTHDALRAGPEAADALAEGTRAMIGDFVKAKGGGPGAEAEALSDLAILVGAVVLARAVGDEGLRDKVLSAVQAARN